MPWSRILDVFLNVEAYGENPLLTGLTSSPRETVAAVSGDTLTVRLWSRTLTGIQGAASVPAQLEAAAQLVLSGKKSTSLDAALSLFLATGFTEHLVGSDYYYEAALDLSAPALTTAFGTDNTLTCTVDVENQNGANTGRQTLQFTLLLRRQGYTGEEEDPTPATLGYPTPVMLARNEYAITALTGGVAGNLDAIATVALPVGLLVAVTLVPGTLSWYRLVAGTDVEAAPNAIRPDDYDAGTNAKVWRLEAATESSASRRSGNVAVTSGNNYVDVVFATPMPGAWIEESGCLENATDAPPAALGLGPIVRDALLGYRRYFLGPAPTANFTYRYNAKLVQPL